MKQTKRKMDWFTIELSNRYNNNKQKARERVGDGMGRGGKETHKKKKILNKTSGDVDKGLQTSKV